MTRGESKRMQINQQIMNRNGISENFCTRFLALINACLHVKHGQTFKKRKMDLKSVLELKSAVYLMCEMHPHTQHKSSCFGCIWS